MAKELAAGKSLAELAKAKGITENQLILKLNDGMTDDLKQWVNYKRPPKAEGNT